MKEETIKLIKTIILILVLILVFIFSVPFIRNDIIGYAQICLLISYSIFIYWRINVIWNRKHSQSNTKEKK
jgi:hypothetical protein